MASWLLLALLHACGLTCRSGGSEVDVAPAGWLTTAVGYEIFVRSFSDSDGDGVGDLRGVQSRLDYLNDGQPGGTDLGVDLLWLMPIHPAASYHGYDVKDFLSVNSEFGTLDDLRALVDEAHRRGMRVILDLVANHTSREHPWFIAARSAPSDTHREWYLWRSDDPGWRQPWVGGGAVWHPLDGVFYYGLFSGGMPDLNYRQPAVEVAMLGVIRHWIALGIDGFRVDAARYLVEEGEQLADIDASHELAREWKREMRRAGPQSVLVAEAWTRTETVASYAGADDEYDLAFNFDLAGVLPIALLAEEGDEIERVLQRTEGAYRRRGFDAPFTANHDFDRLRTAVGDKAGPLRVALALVLTLPGTPFLYYGEEIGARNASDCQGDICRRAPMAWECASPGFGFTAGTPWTPLAPGAEVDCVAAQAADPGSLLTLVRDLIRHRHERPALTSERRRRLETDRAAVYAFTREAESGTVVVVLNLSADEQQSTLDLASVGPSGQELAGRELLSDREARFPIERSRYLLEPLEPYAVRLFAFE